MPLAAFVPVAAPAPRPRASTRVAVLAGLVLITGCAQPATTVPRCPTCPACPAAATAPASGAPAAALAAPPPRTPAGTELPRGEWQTTDGGTVVFHHLPAQAEDVARFEQWFAGTHAALKAAFPEADVEGMMKEPVPCEVWLLPTPTASVAAGRARSNTSYGSGGKAYCEIYFLAPSAMTDADRCCTVVGEPRDEAYLRKVVAHEYGGIFLHRLNRMHAGWRFTQAPLWFLQGYEEWLALQLASEHSRTVTFDKYKALVADNPDRIGFFGVGNEYTDGTVLVAFLHEEFGTPKVRAVLRSKKKSFGEAVQAELGVSAEQLVQRWMRWRKKTFKK